MRAAVRFLAMATLVLIAFLSSGSNDSALNLQMPISVQISFHDRRTQPSQQNDLNRPPESRPISAVQAAMASESPPANLPTSLSTHLSEAQKRIAMSPVQTTTVLKSPPTSLPTSTSSGLPVAQNTVNFGFDRICASDTLTGVTIRKQDKWKAGFNTRWEPNHIRGKVEGRLSLYIEPQRVVNESFSAMDCAQRCVANRDCQAATVGPLPGLKFPNYCHLLSSANPGVPDDKFTSFFMDHRPVNTFTDPGVLYLVLTAKKYAYSRLEMMLNSYLRDEESLLFFDNDTDSVEVAQKIVAKFPLVRTRAAFIGMPYAPDPKKIQTDLGKLGSHKPLMILRYLLTVERGLQHPWYMMVDDDTYIVTHGARFFINSMAGRCCNAACRIGRPVPHQHLIPGVKASIEKPFPYGGSGILFNRQAKHLLTIEQIEYCERNFWMKDRNHYGGDIVLGMCFYYFTGNEMIKSPHFYKWSTAHFVLHSSFSSEYTFGFHRMKDPVLVAATHHCVQAYVPNATEPVPLDLDHLRRCLDNNTAVNWTYYQGLRPYTKSKHEW